MKDEKDKRSPLASIELNKAERPSLVVERRRMSDRLESSGPPDLGLGDDAPSAGPASVIGDLERQIGQVAEALGTSSPSLAFSEALSQIVAILDGAISTAGFESESGAAKTAVIEFHEQLHAWIGRDGNVRALHSVLTRFLAELAQASSA